MSLWKKYKLEVLDPEIAASSTAITQLSATASYVKQLIITFPSTNVGTLRVADTAAKITSGNCLQLLAGQSLTIEVDSALRDEADRWTDLADVFVQKTTGADKIVVAVLRQQTANSGAVY